MKDAPGLLTLVHRVPCTGTRTSRTTTKTCSATTPPGTAPWRTSATSTTTSRVRPAAVPPGLRLPGAHAPCARLRVTILLALCQPAGNSTEYLQWQNPQYFATRAGFNKWVPACTAAGATLPLVLLHAFMLDQVALTMCCCWLCSQVRLVPVPLHHGLALHLRGATQVHPVPARPSPHAPARSPNRALPARRERPHILPTQRPLLLLLQVQAS
jgi:hypothetical protein